MQSYALNDPIFKEGAMPDLDVTKINSNEDR